MLGQVKSTVVGDGVGTMDGFMVTEGIGEGMGVRVG